MISTQMRSMAQIPCICTYLYGPSWDQVSGAESAPLEDFWKTVVNRNWKLRANKHFLGVLPVSQRARWCTPNSRSVMSRTPYVTWVSLLRLIWPVAPIQCRLCSETFEGKSILQEPSRPSPPLANPGTVGLILGSQPPHMCCRYGRIYINHPNPPGRPCAPPPTHPGV